MAAVWGGEPYHSKVMCHVLHLPRLTASEPVSISEGTVLDVRSNEARRRQYTVPDFFPVNATELHEY